MQKGDHLATVNLAMSQPGSYNVIKISVLRRVPKHFCGTFRHLGVWSMPLIIVYLSGPQTQDLISQSARPVEASNLTKNRLKSPSLFAQILVHHEVGCDVNERNTVSLAAPFSKLFLTHIIALQVV